MSSRTSSAAWGLTGPVPYKYRSRTRTSRSDRSPRSSCGRSTRGSSRSSGLPIDDVRGPLAARLARLLPGPRRPAAARRGRGLLLDATGPSNEALRQRHFPGPRQRCSTRTSRHTPRSADPMDFAIGDLAGVAAMLHTAATREARRLEAEIAIRDARLHWLRQEPAAAAELAIGRALAWSPDHPDAYRTLAENLLRQGRLDEALAAAARAAEHRPDVARVLALPGHPSPPHRRPRRRRRGAAAGARARARPRRRAGRARTDPLPAARAASAALPAASKRGRSMPKTTLQPDRRRPRRPRQGRPAPARPSPDRAPGRPARASRPRPRSSRRSRPAPSSTSAPSATSRAARSTTSASAATARSRAASSIGPHEHPTDWLTTSRIAYYPEVNGWDALVAGPIARRRSTRCTAPFPPAARSPRSAPTSGSARAPSSRPA